LYPECPRRANSPPSKLHNKHDKNIPPRLFSRPRGDGTLTGHRHSRTGVRWTGTVAGLGSEQGWKGCSYRRPSKIALLIALAHDHRLPIYLQITPESEAAARQRAGYYHPEQPKFYCREPHTHRHFRPSCIHRESKSVVRNRVSVGK